MNIERFDQEHTKAIDYILNYQPDTRIKYTLDEDLVEDLIDSGIVEKVEKEDDYSTTYHVLRIHEDYRNEAKQTVEDRFEDRYPNFEQEMVQEIFQEDVGGMFELYNKAQSTNGEGIRSSRRVPTSLFDDLAEAGFGFRRQYLTTTDNLNDEFVFRSIPVDGKAAFLDFANSVIRSHLEGLSQIEKWAIYVKSVVGTGSIMSNPAEFSPDELGAIIDTSSITEVSDENLDFIREDIKDFLRTKIYKFLEKDALYFSVLEYFKLRSENDGHIGTEFTEDIGSEKQESVQHCVDQLANAGILLRRGDDTFVLTEQIRDIVTDIEKRTVVVSYPIRSRKEGQEILFEILNVAQDGIKIIDQYFDGKALSLLSTVVPKKEDLDIHILTAVEDDRRADLVDEYEGLIGPSRYEIRVLEGDHDTPHDRFLIVDGDKIWQVGHSFNGLGKEFSTIFLHSEEESAEYRKLFDSLWEDGTPLHGADK